MFILQRSVSERRCVYILNFMLQHIHVSFSRLNKQSHSSILLWDFTC